MNIEHQYVSNWNPDHMLIDSNNNALLNSVPLACFCSYIKSKIEYSPFQNIDSNNYILLLSNIPSLNVLWYVLTRFPSWDIEYWILIIEYGFWNILICFGMFWHSFPSLGMAAKSNDNTTTTESWKHFVKSSRITNSHLTSSNNKQILMEYKIYFAL